jgi:hypothetical protein
MKRSNSPISLHRTETEENYRFRVATVPPSSPLLPPPPPPPPLPPSLPPPRPTPNLRRRPPILPPFLPPPARRVRALQASTT